MSSCSVYQTCGLVKIRRIHKVFPRPNSAQSQQLRLTHQQRGGAVDITRTTADLPTSIPASLTRLKELAFNLWWSWTPEARRLFEHIDPTLWVLTHHNPVKLLADVRPERLMHLAEDPSYMRLYSAALKTFDGYCRNGRSTERRGGVG